MKNYKFIIIASASLLLASCSTQRKTLTFICFGDWGRDGNFGQKETAEQMGIYAEKNEADFILTLGDNFYETGVTGTDDPKWQNSFENIYTAPSLQIPWYVTLGNHDYGGSIQAQINYSRISKRWNLPARYYSFEKNIDESARVLFVIIDTNPFIKNYLDSVRENEELNAVSVNDLRQQDTKLQLHWIDSVLSHSAARWKIVAGHHPVYSGGVHGNTKELVERLKPVLEKNNVTMYICGHDHDMQYLKESGSKVNYFVAGSGSQLRPAGKMDYTIYSNSVNGFLSVKITDADIKASFIDVNGQELYSTAIK